MKEWKKPELNNLSVESTEGQIQQRLQCEKCGHILYSWIVPGASTQNYVPCKRENCDGFYALRESFVSGL